LGRIRMLEDTDGDGRYDQSTIFAENLPWPTALFWYDGGLFVGCTPDILYLKDTNGDNKADERKVIYTGFAAGVARLNVQGLLNNFQWGLDNRIHGATGPNGGRITSQHFPAKTVELRGRDFSFDPRNLSDFRAETGGGQHGLSFDNTGRKYICSNSDHIRLCMYEDRYANRNPFYNMPPPVVSIAIDGPAAEVYRISLEEPWRVLRTQWRVNGTVPGLIEGGGRSSGYFTSAAGITIYRGDAFPPAYVGDAFIADVGSNLIHRKRVQPDGVKLIAQRPAGEEKAEFIASRDLWFRPVQFANAPDGTLYVADMYREVIEHPWSIPESIKRHLDLNSGNDRGRIYRIAPDGFRQPQLAKLGDASTKKLLAALGSPNGWHRDTAARLVYEKHDPAVAAGLASMARTGTNGLARLHALHALDGFGKIDVEVLTASLQDDDSSVREHAILLMEEVWPRLSESHRIGLWNTLKPLVNDPSPGVRYQLAFTIGEIEPPDATKALTKMARKDYQDAYIQAAILSSLKSGAGEMLQHLSGDANLASSGMGQKLITELVYLVGAHHRSIDLEAVSEFLRSDPPLQLLFSALRALGDGLERGGSSLAKSSLDLTPILARAEQAAQDGTVEENVRTQAIQLLGTLPFAQAKQKLFALLSVQQPQSVQLAALQSLRKYSDPVMASMLLQRWPTLTPRLRAEALSVLLERPERALLLLKNVESDNVHANELNSTQVRFLRQHKNASVRDEAERLLVPTQKSSRQEVVNSFQSVLNLKGNAQAGKLLYEQRCASCHRAGKAGNAVGPDLVTIKNSGREKLLINILDPNREVPANYLTYLVETKDGESILGILARENNASVTLRQAFAREDTVPRSSILTLKNQGQSLMPEGLEAGLDQQAMANLLEFIETLEITP
jgi:putative membrane-bound dehydrogenase-like protein